MIMWMSSLRLGSTPKPVTGGRPVKWGVFGGEDGFL